MHRNLKKFNTTKYRKNDVIFYKDKSANGNKSVLHTDKSNIALFAHRTVDFLSVFQRMVVKH
jgi:hypothetical protein